MTTAAPTTAQRICWFEYTAGKFIDNEKRGHPDRIWSSDDPRWAEFIEKKKLVNGRLIVANVTRVGDEIFPSNYQPEHLFMWFNEQAHEKMKFFEANGRLWNDDLAEAVKADELKAERAQQSLATAIATAIRGEPAPAGAKS